MPLRALGMFSGDGASRQAGLDGGTDSMSCGRTAFREVEERRAGLNVDARTKSVPQTVDKVRPSTPPAVLVDHGQYAIQVMSCFQPGDRMLQEIRAALITAPHHREPRLVRRDAGARLWWGRRS